MLHVKGNDRHSYGAQIHADILLCYLLHCRTVSLGAPQPPTSLQGLVPDPSDCQCTGSRESVLRFDQDVQALIRGGASFLSGDRAGYSDIEAAFQWVARKLD